MVIPLTTGISIPGISFQSRLSCNSFQTASRAKEKYTYLYSSFFFFSSTLSWPYPQVTKTPSQPEYLFTQPRPVTLSTSIRHCLSHEVDNMDSFLQVSFIQFSLLYIYLLFSFTETRLMTRFFSFDCPWCLMKDYA